DPIRDREPSDSPAYQCGVRPRRRAHDQFQPAAVGRGCRPPGRCVRAMGSASTLRRSLMRIILLVSTAGLIVTSCGFCICERLIYRQTSQQQLETLGAAIASNSTAALAFDNSDDAATVLSAFKAEPHIVAAALYDAHGKLFATYARKQGAGVVPAAP